MQVSFTVERRKPTPRSTYQRWIIKIILHRIANFMLYCQMICHFLQTFMVFYLCKQSSSSCKHLHHTFHSIVILPRWSGFPLNFHLFSHNYMTYQPRMNWVNPQILDDCDFQELKTTIVHWSSIDSIKSEKYENSFLG